MSQSRSAAFAVVGVLAGSIGCSATHPGSAHLTSIGSVPSSRPTVAPTTSTRPTAVARPTGGPVPGGFAATSVTFVSPSQAFVLGTAPCSTRPCTSILRTLDRGRGWVGLPAPRVPIGPGAAGSGVWGIRFATPTHGFVFGHGLWETTDGAAHWRPVSYPGGSVLALAVVADHVLTLTAACGAQTGCQQPASLQARPVAGGAWQPVASVHTFNQVAVTNLIATQGNTAAVLDGTAVIVLRAGSPPVRRPTPCTTLGVGYPVSVAISSATGLALLCQGQGYTGHTDKQVYASADQGAHWAAAGRPSSDGDGGILAAADTVTFTIATYSAASWLFHSATGGTTWQVVRTDPDGGFGWADLGFTTTAQGVVVHGPAISDGNTENRPGQLLLTSDGGSSWTLASL